MSSEQLASVPLGMTTYEALRFYSESVGEPLILNGFSGAGLTMGVGFTLASAAAVDTGIPAAVGDAGAAGKVGHRIIAVISGSEVQISGGAVIAAAGTPNTWNNIFSIDCRNNQATTSSSLQLLRPHPALLAYTVDKGVGNTGDAGLAAASDFICGQAWGMGGASHLALGAANGSGTNTTIAAPVRIVETATAGIFSVQVLFGAVLVDTNSTEPDMCFVLRYPTAPVSRAINLA